MRPVETASFVIRHLRLPLVHPFETSFGRVDHQETLIVEAHAGGLTGYGESPASAAPYYCAETVQTCLHVDRDFLIPLVYEAQRAVSTHRGGHGKLLRAERHTARGSRPCAGAGRRRRAPARLALQPAVLPALFARVRGHNVAKAGIEAALCDLESQLRSVPLHKLYCGTRRRIASGVSLGIEPTIADLLELVRVFVSRGYRRIKLKIKPGWDIEVVARVRKEFPTFPLMADANSAYTLRDSAHLKKLDRYRLMMIEQPLGWDDIVDHARLQRALRTPICLDESVHGPADARKAIELGACRVINIKPARVGGPTTAKAVHDICRKAGVPVWCGGMLETGIGRAHNIAIATLPGFSLPSDISGSDRYYARDVIEPPVRVSSSGMIDVPQTPGLGFTPVPQALESHTLLKVEIRA